MAHAALDDDHGDGGRAAARAGRLGHSARRLPPRHAFSTSAWPAVKEVFENVLGGAPIVAPSGREDLVGPELRPLIDRYYRGTGASALERIKLFKLVWDAIGTEFGGAPRALRAQLRGQPRAGANGRGEVRAPHGALDQLHRARRPLPRGLRPRRLDRRYLAQVTRAPCGRTARDLQALAAPPRPARRRSGRSVRLDPGADDGSTVWQRRAIDLLLKRLAQVRFHARDTTYAPGERLTGAVDFHNHVKWTRMRGPAGAVPEVPTHSDVIERISPRADLAPCPLANVAFAGSRRGRKHELGSVRMPSLCPKVHAPVQHELPQSDDRLVTVVVVPIAGRQEFRRRRLVRSIDGLDERGRGRGWGRRRRLVRAASTTCRAARFRRGRSDRLAFAWPASATKPKPKT